jgi:hypothetical protein
MDSVTAQDVHLYIEHNWIYLQASFCGNSAVRKEGHGKGARDREDVNVPSCWQLFRQDLISNLEV